MRARDVNPYDLNAVAKADRQPRPRDTSWRPLKLQREYDKLLASVKELGVETARALAVPVAELLNRKIAEAEARAEAAEKQLAEATNAYQVAENFYRETDKERKGLEQQLAEAQQRIAELEATASNLIGRLTQAQTQAGRYRQEALGYYEQIAELERLVPEADLMERLLRDDYGINDMKQVIELAEAIREYREGK